MIKKIATGTLFDEYHHLYVYYDEIMNLSPTGTFMAVRMGTDATVLLKVHGSLVLRWLHNASQSKGWSIQPGFAYDDKAEKLTAAVYSLLQHSGYVPGDVKLPDFLPLALTMA